MPANTSAIRAGKAFVELSADDSALVRGLRRAQAKLKAFGEAVSSAGEGLLKIGAVAAAGIGAALRVFTAQGDALQKMALRTGISVEALSELGYAAGQSGADMETLEAGVRGMQRVLNDAATGMKSANDSLATLGLSIEDLKGLSPEQQFKLIADRLSQVADPTQRAAVAMELFGRSGQKLLPLMSGGAAGIAALEEEARRMGLTISGETADAAAAFGDELDRLKQAVGRVLLEIGAALAPTVQAFAQRVRESIKEAVAWVRANRDTIITILKVTAVVTAAGAALLILGKVLGALATTIGVVASAVKGLTVAFTFLAAHPVVAALAAITAGIVALTLAMRRSSAETQRVIQQSRELVAAGQQQRLEDLLRLERLKQLADKQQLTNEEMAEAKTLTGQLQGKYGDLAIVLDETKRTITGVTDAQRNLNQAMREMAALEIDRQLRPLQDQLAKVNKELAETKANLETGRRFVRGYTNFTTDLPNLRTLLDEQFELMQEVGKLKRLRDSVLQGDQAALLGQQPGQGLQQRVAQGELDAVHRQREIEERNKRIADAEEELTRLQEQAARRRRSSVENEIEDIRRLAAEREKLIQLLIEEERQRPGGASVTRLEQLGVQLRRNRQERDQDIQGVHDREAERDRVPDDGRGRHAVGSSTTNRAPTGAPFSSARFSAQMTPPWLTTIWREMASPRPELLPKAEPCGRLV